MSPIYAIEELLNEKGTNYTFTIMNGNNDYDIRSIQVKSLKYGIVGKIILYDDFKLPDEFIPAIRFSLADPDIANKILNVLNGTRYEAVYLGP